MENRYDKFTSLITNINRNIQKIKNVEMERLGLKGKQVQVMFNLFNLKEGASSTELCSLCGEDKGAISRTIKELEEGGYVFVDESPLKKYKNPIKLTKKGVEIGEIVSEKIDKYFNLGRKGVNEKDIDKFYAMLTMISNNLDEICENYDKD